MQNQTVPYQAYRSKRHSRTASVLPIPPNVPPPDWDAEKLVLDITPAGKELPLLPQSEPPTVNGTHPSSSSSSSSPPTPPKKLTTFRRLYPARPASTLRPPEPQSRAPSSSSSYQPDRVTPSPRSPSPHSRVPSINSVISDAKPNLVSPSHTPNSSLATTIQPSLLLPSASVSSSLSPSPVISPPVSSSPLPRPPPRSSATYRPGFQPRGVYRHRTDEFAQARKVKHDATRIERTKLERRLEKLIHLHFPIQDSETIEPKKLAVERRKSLFDLDLASLKNMGASDVWKGVIQSQALQGTKYDIRAVEQRIAPWQEDAIVSKCPLCTASFHSITNRKHHCRLCGQIVCSLPIKRPLRNEPCSILFIVDSKTRQIEEVGEGVDYGVKRRVNGTGSPGKSNGKENQRDMADDEKFLKGVRVCRTCKSILSREQFFQEVSRVPPLVRLYEAFITLEKDIEEALPQFQELLLTLNSDSPPDKEANAARKQILDDFTSYDAISKRICKIPCTPGSSQDRVHLAIRTRADLFLQKYMFPLQSLPKAKKQLPSPDAPTPLVDPDSELAHALQPLLEQEALLNSFVGEAMAHRKFEDAKTLKANLKEIRAEIDRMLENRTTNGND